MRKKEKKMGGIISTPIGVVAVETYWGIAETTTPRTAISVYMDMAL